MSMRIFGDAALPPHEYVLYYLSEHLFLVLGILLGVILITLVLITLLKKNKKRK